MNCELIKTFLGQRESFEGKEYLFHTIAFHIAPVLDKHKPATVLTFKKGKRNLRNLWSEHRDSLPLSEELSWFQIQLTPDKATVLFYNRNLLLQELKDTEHNGFLKQCGYRLDMTLEDYLFHLRSRYEHGCPHEIGLFLGIPIEDTISFIEQKGKNYIEIGYWKVYHNFNRAKSTFELYERAKQRFMKFIHEGNSLYQYFQNSIA